MEPEGYRYIHVKFVGQNPGVYCGIKYTKPVRTGPPPARNRFGNVHARFLVNIRNTTAKLTEMSTAAIVEKAFYFKDEIYLLAINPSNDTAT